MKKPNHLKPRHIFALLILFCINLQSVNAQHETIVSEKWKSTEGTQNFFYQSVTRIDPFSNVYIAGATINGLGKYDILLAKYSPDGTLIWVYQHDEGHGGNDVATAIYLDQNQNVYVTGSSYQGQADSNMIITLKVDFNGVFDWSELYSGSSPGMAGGVGISGDNQGHIYVCGTVFNGIDYDLTSIKYSTSGSFYWAKKIDNGGKNDIGHRIIYNEDNNGPTVSGITIDFPAWSYMVLNYDSDGEIVDDYISDPNQIDIDKLTDITRDNSGNFYLTGGMPSQNHGYSFFTIKLNRYLNVLWTASWEAPGSDYNMPNTIRVDPAGNVVVGGFSNFPGQGKSFALVKYNSSGQKQWDRHFKDGGDAEITALLIDQSSIIVTGISNNNYRTVKYDSIGEYTWSIEYAGQGIDKPSGVAIDNAGKIVVSGQSATASPGEYSYVTVMYDELIHPSVFINGSDSLPLFAANEIIVKFDPSIVKLPKINTRGAQFFDLYDILDSSFVDNMSLQTGIDFASQKAIKIFPEMTSTDTTTTSRLGNSIKIPEFWSVFRITLPPNTNIGPVLTALNNKNLRSGFFPQIRYAEPSWALKLTSTPNDEHYEDKQLGLFYNPNYPQYEYAHINAEPAWALGAVGDPKTKVGVFDTGINFRHEDFRIDPNAQFSPNLFDYTQIRAGRDYTKPGFPVSSFAGQPDNHGHGTPVAGIIGAVRNNEIGVAGVAGGDYEHSTGVSLYDMNCLALQLRLTDVSAAYYAGVIDYKLDIMNHSWCVSFNFNPTMYSFTDTSLNLLKDMVRFASENEILQVYARGNVVGDTISYPSSFYPDWQTGDDWVLSVGGSGNDGEKNFFSSYGRQLDVIGPFTPELHYTTHRSVSNNEYQVFGGTSGAAPMVSGVAALLMGYHRGPLAPEDIERLIKYSATDKDVPGYDINTGWGLLNAGAAIELIKYPDYRVVHYDVEPNLSSHEGTDFFIDTLVADYGVHAMGPITLN
ncbi:MAG: S8 family serine peptidase, partial [Bacteroidetes bacterium]|nr:S8 family serine peptidase [Bacteroidota bacterium]